MSTSIPFKHAHASTRRGPDWGGWGVLSLVLSMSVLGCDALEGKVSGGARADAVPPPVYVPPSTNVDDFVLARATSPSLGQEVATFIAERLAGPDRGAAVAGVDAPAPIDPAAAVPAAAVPGTEVPPVSAVAPAEVPAAIPGSEPAVPAAAPVATVPAAVPVPAEAPVPAAAPADAVAPPAEAVAVAAIEPAPALPSVTEAAPPAEPEAKPEPKPEPKPKSASTSSSTSSSSTPVSAKKKPKDEEDSKPGVSGRAIFASKCKSCHGVSGKADTPMGVKLGMTSFKSPGWKREWTEAKVIDIVKNGKAGSKMKPFEGKLTPAEIEAVARFARAIGQ